MAEKSNIRKMGKSVKLNRFIYQYILPIKWKLELYSSRLYSVSNIKKENILRLSSEDKILILVPHADDEWIGCGQIISNYKVDVFYFNYLSKNYNQKNQKIRQQELEKLRDLFSFNLYISQSYNDYSDLLKLLQENNYTHIFLPTFIDYHPEHIKISSVLKNIILKQNLTIEADLFFYQIAIPLPKELDLYYSIMNKKDYQNKTLIFDEIYRSQKNTPIRRMNIQNRINACGTKNYALEVYAKIETTQWLKIMTSVENLKETFMKELTINIGKLLKTRKLSSAILFNINRK